MKGELENMDVLFRNAIRTRKGPLVILFYDGFEWRLERGLLGRAKAQLRRFARFAYRTLRRKQVRTGFYTQFLNLCAALSAAGCDVRINDHALAQQNPHYPIGVAGYPTVLGKFPKTNPVIFGPGDFGMPDEMSGLADAPQFGSLICFCDWIGQIYRQACKGRITTWFAGIDVKNWPETAADKKDIDCLIYDKIRWDRTRLEPELISGLSEHIAARGLSVHVIRYGSHAQREYRSLLARARSLVFICEHETQGLAYQEALASNVPVFAWDEGRLIDPVLGKYAPAELVVSSVPYFDETCGARFKLATMRNDFDRFWRNLPDYRPRAFVENNLSPEDSARRYLTAYFGLISKAPAGERNVERV